MEFGPILSAMRRNKVGATLIVVQMAVTLSILCNGLFIIQQRLALSQRPSGTDEADIFAVVNVWVDDPKDLPARLQTDLAMLRTLPGVVDAYASNSYPLSNGGAFEGVSLHPDQVHTTTGGAVYLADDHALHTLGVKLVAGRNFNATDVADLREDDVSDPSGVIVTRALGLKLFPAGDALGRSVYLESVRRIKPIIGIVDRLQTPYTSASVDSVKYNDNSMLEPFRPITARTIYLVRAQRGRLASVMQAAQESLFSINLARVLPKVQSLAEARAESYRETRGLVVILGSVCIVMLAVTAFGIVGLTSYWVSQRRRQIGIRRALGATRAAIIRYFQTENLLIASAGVLVGMALAIGLNLWMVRSFEMLRLQASYPIVGALILLLLGQFAVLWPALRAASIPPALAMRGG